MSSPSRRRVPEIRPVLATWTDRSVRHMTGLVLARDFPGLPGDRLAASGEFVARRVGQLGGPARLGVHTLAIALRGLGAVPIVGRGALAFVARHPLPLVGEYLRLIRSLGYAFIWEHWPDTRFDGATV